VLTGTRRLRAIGRGDERLQNHGQCPAPRPLFRRYSISQRIILLAPLAKPPAGPNTVSSNTEHQRCFMRRSDWTREYRRARCGAPTAHPLAVEVYCNRFSHWEHCALHRAYWLATPTMRAHRLSWIGTSRQALARINPRLP